MRKLIADEAGAAATEYAFITGLLVTAVAAFYSLPRTIQTTSATLGHAFDSPAATRAVADRPSVGSSSRLAPSAKSPGLFRHVFARGVGDYALAAGAIGLATGAWWTLSRSTESPGGQRHARR